MSETSAATVQTRVPGFWSSLREAVMGTSQDFTEGSIGRAIVLLAVPMVLEMCMESLFGVVDVFWVAHLGADAITTVGLTETALTVLFVIALGLSMGATALVCPANRRERRSRRRCGGGAGHRGRTGDCRDYGRLRLIPSRPTCCA